MKRITSCREDILIHAFAQCRSNKGAPGIDGQDFADVETYGVGGLANWRLRSASYRPAPSRVFIPKANGRRRNPQGTLNELGQGALAPTTAL